MHMYYNQKDSNQLANKYSFIFPFSDLNAAMLGLETRMRLAKENIEGTGCLN